MMPTSGAVSRSPRLYWRPIVQSHGSDPQRFRKYSGGSVRASAVRESASDAIVLTFWRMAQTHQIEPRSSMAVFKELEDLLSPSGNALTERKGCFDEYIPVHGLMLPSPRLYDEIHPNLYLGGEAVARDKTFLQSQGFTHIVNCAEGKKFNQVNTGDKFYTDLDLRYLAIPAHDSVRFDLSKFFSGATEFIHEGLSHNGKVLVHCHQGISRSAAVVIAYLMRFCKMNAVQALKHTMTKRPIRPNTGFLKQLAAFQQQLASP